MPAHTHGVQGSTTSNSGTPAGNAWASGQKGFGNVYAPPGNNVQMSSAMSVTGGNLPHNNMPPFLGLTFIIALQGVFPARS